MPTTEKKSRTKCQPWCQQNANYGWHFVRLAFCPVGILSTHRRGPQKWSQWKLAKSVLVYKSVCEMRSLWKSLNRWETKQFGNLEHFSPIHQLVESGSIRGGAFVFITYQHHRHCTKFIHLIKSWIMNHLLVLINFEASRMDPTPQQSYWNLHFGKAALNVSYEKPRIKMLLQIASGKV